ncbi:hypothetical protein RFI_33230, partial [Reticulomyxa filosa]
VNNPTIRYEEEKKEWERQKTKGLEVIQSLQRKNTELEQQLMALSMEAQKHKEDEHRWQQERAAGYELMASLQQKLQSFEKDKKDVIIPPINEFVQNPHDTILELTNEVEQSHFTVGNLQETVDRLGTENKRLWKEIMTLRDRRDEKLLQQGQMSYDPSYLHLNGMLFSAVRANDN